MKRMTPRSPMGALKLSAACALAAAILVVAVAPVWAGWDVNVYFRHAGPGQDPRTFTPTADSVIDGSYSVVVDATSSSSLYAFQVEIQPVNPSYALGDAARVNRSYSPGSRQSDRITIGWDTRSLTPYNGQYQITARAWSQVELQESKLTGIIVDNRPAAPSGVKVKLQNDVPLVSWSPNSEPDLIDYIVYRSKDSGAYSAIGTAAGTTFKDTKAPMDSSLRYLVVANRRSFARSTGRIESTPSSPTQAVSIVSATEEEPARTVAVPEPAKAPDLPPVAVESSESNQLRTRSETEFSQTLPYQAQTTDPAATAFEPEPEPEPVVAPRGARSVLTLASVSSSAPSVDPFPFLAAALLLAGVSLHLLRAAWVLARS